MQRVNIWRKTQLLLAVSLILQGTIAAASNFVLNFTRLECLIDQPGLFGHMYCEIGNVVLPPSYSPPKKSKVVTGMNLAVLFARVPKPHFYARTIGRMKPKVGDTNTIFDIRLDICEFFQNKFASKMFNILWKNVLEYINVRPECPMKSNFTYSVKNFRFNPHDFPSYLSEAIYILEFNFKEGETQFAHLHMWIEVISRQLNKVKRRRH